jgi:type VI secretion system protein ImpA
MTAQASRRRPVALSPPAGHRAVRVALDLGGGSLASKQAACAHLGEIAGFFRRTEPHSPVAYLLERAIVWADMPLEQFLAELIRDESTLSSIRERVGLPPSY